MNFFLRTTHIVRKGALEREWRTSSPKPISTHKVVRGYRGESLESEASSSQADDVDILSPRQRRSGQSDAEASKIPIASYEGDMVNGMRHGKGKAVYENGDVYEGGWVDDVREGLGKLDYPDGGYYSGHFQNDLAHGPSGTYEGASRFDTLIRYTGEWKHGAPHGEGIAMYDASALRSLVEYNLLKEEGEDEDSEKQSEVAPSSAAPGALQTSQSSRLWVQRYEGSFVHGIRSGIGTLTGAQPNGHRFEYHGSFRDDFANGQGTLENKSGTKYEGEFRDGWPHGRGRLMMKDGSSYTGTFFRGEREGRGTYHSPDGTHFTGDWRHSLKNGRGVLIFPNGDIYTGHFLNGAIEGKGRMQYRGGGDSLAVPAPPRLHERSTSGLNEDGGRTKFYDGNWHLGVIHGYGTAVYEDPEGHEERYVGFWANGVPHGEGDYYFVNPKTKQEVRFCGNWKEGKRDGHCSFTVLSTGVLWRAVFKDDELVGVLNKEVPAPNPEAEEGQKEKKSTLRRKEKKSTLRRKAEKKSTLRRK